MNRLISAIIVTRGGQNLMPILDSIPDEWQKLVWDNGTGRLHDFDNGSPRFSYFCEVPDLKVYGRYAAIEKRAVGDVIYVQDDDVIVSDPGGIVDAWAKEGTRRALKGGSTYYTESAGSSLPPDLSRDFVVCNMPQEFRHDFYEDHALVGFGAAFHRDAPARAFERMWNIRSSELGLEGMSKMSPMMEKAFEVAKDPVMWPAFFLRTCDIVFTGLTPRVLVDVPYERMPWDSDPDRMWKQPDHLAERSEMLKLVKGVRG
jgi:hypothetical protein